MASVPAEDFSGLRDRGGGSEHRQHDDFTLGIRCIFDDLTGEL
jgi:hypothetical protein